MPRPRDPDALPPRNAFEWVMSILYYAAASLTHGNALFAIKAGLFTVVLCLPFFIKNSAAFAYRKCISQSTHVVRMLISDLGRKPSCVGYVSGLPLAGLAIMSHERNFTESWASLRLQDSEATPLLVSLPVY